MAIRPGRSAVPSTSSPWAYGDRAERVFAADLSAWALRLKAEEKAAAIKSRQEADLLYPLDWLRERDRLLYGGPIEKRDTWWDGEPLTAKKLYEGVEKLRSWPAGRTDMPSLLPADMGIDLGSDDRSVFPRFKWYGEGFSVRHGPAGIKWDVCDDITSWPAAPSPEIARVVKDMCGVPEAKCSTATIGTVTEPDPVETKDWAEVMSNMEDVECSQPYSTPTPKRRGTRKRPARLRKQRNR